MHGQANIRKWNILLIKYIKSILWRVAKRLSNIEDARCLKVNKGDYWCLTYLRTVWQYDKHFICYCHALHSSESVYWKCNTVTFLRSFLCLCLLQMSSAMADTILWYPSAGETKPASSSLVRYSLRVCLHSWRDLLQIWTQ